MKILIAGGTGMIGEPLTRALLADGHEVMVLTRSPHTARLPAGAIPLGWDAQPSGASAWADQLEDADAVINLAGANIGDSPWTAARKHLIRASRVDAGLAIASAFALSQNKPPLLLQASAVGYYGTSESDTYTEASRFGKDFLAGVGVDWEASTQAVEALGVRRILLRTGIVLAPDGGVLPKLLLPLRLGVGGRLGSGRQWLSWIHLQDEIDAIRFLLRHPSAAGPVNLTAPHPATNAEMVRALAQLLRRPDWLPVPAFALRLLLGEMSTLVLDGQRVLPQRLQDWGYAFRFPELRPALTDLLG